MDNAIENSLHQYGEEAELLLIGEDGIRNAMKAGRKIEEIIKGEGRVRFWILFVSGSILFLSCCDFGRAVY